MSILLKNSIVFTENDPSMRADIRIAGDKITEVAEQIIPQEGEKVIDLSGYTVYPGFFNAHVHTVHNGKPFSKDIFQEFVRNGCTTLRDMGMISPGDVAGPMKQLKNMIHDPTLPRVLTCGKFICMPETYGCKTPEPDVIFMDDFSCTPEEAAAKVNFYADLGCDGAKVAMDTGKDIGYNFEIPPDEFYEAVFKAAKERGLWVSCHVRSSELLEQFAKFGSFEVSHISNDPMSPSLITRLKEMGTYVCATLAIYEFEGKNAGDNRLEGAMKNTRILYEAGIPLVVGNDMIDDIPIFEHGIPIREMQLMCQAGIPVNEVIRSATINAAHSCWISDVTGSVAPGKSADLIAINTPVDKTFSCFKHIPLVINRGTIIVDQT